MVLPTIILLTLLMKVFLCWIALIYSLLDFSQECRACFRDSTAYTRQMTKNSHGVTCLRELQRCSNSAAGKWMTPRRRCSTSILRYMEWWIAIEIQALADHRHWNDIPETVLKFVVYMSVGNVFEMKDSTCKVLGFWSDWMHTIYHSIILIR